MSTQSDQPSAPIELKSFSNPNARTIPDLLSEAKSLTEQVRLSIVRDDLSGAESAAKQLTSLRSNYRSAFDELDRLHILAGMSDAMGGYDPRVPSPIRGGVGLDLPDYAGGAPMAKQTMRRMRQDAGYSSLGGLADIWSEVAQLRAQDTMLRVSGVDTDMLRKVKNGEVTLKPRIAGTVDMEQWLGVTPDERKGEVYRKAIFTPVGTARDAALEEYGDSRAGSLLANIVAEETLKSGEMGKMLSLARDTALATGDRDSLVALKNLDAKKIGTGIKIKRNGEESEASLQEVRDILQSTDIADPDIATNKAEIHKSLNAMVAEAPVEKRKALVAALNEKLGVGAVGTSALKVGGDRPATAAEEKAVALATKETGAIASMFGLSSDFEDRLRDLETKAPGYSSEALSSGAGMFPGARFAMPKAVSMSETQDYWASVWKAERAKAGAAEAKGSLAEAKRSRAVADFAAKKAAAVIEKRIRAKELSLDSMSADTEAVWKASKLQSAGAAGTVAAASQTTNVVEIPVTVGGKAVKVSPSGPGVTQKDGSVVYPTKQAGNVTVKDGKVVSQEKK